MFVSIVMANGLGARLEIDEKLLDLTQADPVAYAMSKLRPVIEECVSRRHEEAPEL